MIAAQQRENAQKPARRKAHRMHTPLTAFHFFTSKRLPDDAAPPAAPLAASMGVSSSTSAILARCLGGETVRLS